MKTIEEILTHVKPVWHIFCLAEPCWEWQRARTTGYGRVHYQGRLQSTHRAIYEHLIGPIPEGLQLDHICVNRICGNPTHTHPVTQRENLLTGSGFAGCNYSVTHCPSGHAYNAKNTYIYKLPNGHTGRRCRECNRLGQVKCNVRRKSGIAPEPRAKKTHCIRGHPFDADNTAYYPDGRRYCCPCLKIRNDLKQSRRLRQDLTARVTFHQ